MDRIRTEAGARTQAFAMGEIFTGSGAAGTADIRYFMGPDGLDSAFDFPLMWALRAAVAGDGSFAEVEASLANHGLTLGHFPQSWELATVGWWSSCWDPMGMAKVRF